MVLIKAIGPRNTGRFFVKYPHLLLISFFSFWTVGPMNNSSASSNHKIGISFSHTLKNVLVSFFGSLFGNISFILYYNHWKSSIPYKDQCGSREFPCWGIFLYISLFHLGSHIFAYVFLQLTQFVRCCGSNARNLKTFDINDLNLQDQVNANGEEINTMLPKIQKEPKNQV